MSASYSIEVEAETLEEARKKVESEIPEGLSLLSEKVVSDGMPKATKGTGETEEAAFAKAQSQMPTSAEVLERKVLSAPELRILTFKSFNEEDKAHLEARIIAGITNELVKTVRLVKAGKKRFLGLWPATHLYEAEVMQAAPYVVEITYKSKARITAVVGNTESSVLISGARYLDECFDTGFTSVGRDVRQWRDIPEARVIPELVNEGKVEEALKQSSILMEKYSDFYFSYYWLGSLYYDQKKYEEARTRLKEGYERCIRKQDLCDMLARVALKSDDLPEAVKWWIRSVIIRVSTDSFEDPDPFLYLSYIAQALGLNDASAKFTVVSNRIRPVGLDSHTASLLARMARSQGSESLRKAIHLASNRLSESISSPSSE